LRRDYLRNGTARECGILPRGVLSQPLIFAGFQSGARKKSILMS
jgi:hypothetical protein